MWWAIGRFLGIIKAILITIESEARKKVSLKQSCEMFQLWLDGREGTGDEDRSWFVILRVLVDIGRSDIIFEIQEHFDLKTKDIDRGENVHDIVLLCVQVLYVCYSMFDLHVCAYVHTYMYLLVNSQFYPCCVRTPSHPQMVFLSPLQLKVCTSIIDDIVHIFRSSLFVTHFRYC